MSGGHENDKSPQRGHIRHRIHPASEIGVRRPSELASGTQSILSEIKYEVDSVADELDEG